MLNVPSLPLRGAISDGRTVQMDEIPSNFVTQLAGWDKFLSAANDVLGNRDLSVPADYRVPVSSGNARVFRIAPNKVLVRSVAAFDVENTDDLVALDLSDARRCLELKGPGAADLLGRVMAIDFSIGAFPVGSFVQAGLDHIGVLVERLENDLFVLQIPTSWTSSVISMLGLHVSKVA